MWKPRVTLAVLTGLCVASAGSSQAVMTPQLEIYSLSATGGQQRNLSNSPLDDFDPAYSPDGRKIAFVRGPRDAQELWLMNADGTDQRQLTRTVADEWAPTWSPDGRLIAFTAGVFDFCPPRPCPTWTVMVVRPDGTGLREIMSGRNPVWSPNGQNLVLETQINPYGEAEALLIVRLAGGSRRLGHGPPYRLFAFSSASWAPDGRRVAFAATHGDGSAAYSVRAGGGGRRVHFLRGRRPAWSPTRSELAVLGYDRYVHAVPTGRGRARSLARADAFAWDRRGSRLVLFREQGGGEIAVIDRDGRRFRILQRSVGDLRWMHGGTELWSRDGRRFLYVTPAPGRAP